MTGCGWTAVDLGDDLVVTEEIQLNEVYGDIKDEVDRLFQGVRKVNSDVDVAHHATDVYPGIALTKSYYDAMGKRTNQNHWRKELVTSVISVI
jgi:hypothetical protein